MKKYFYALCMATALGAVGCSDDEVINSGDVIDPSLKTSISFSASDEAGGGTSTKALTKADDGFAAATQIAARFVSQEGSTTNFRFTRTLLQAAPKGSESYSNVTYDSEYNRYWDDAFGRAAQISVYAIAVPGKTGVTNGGNSLEEQLDYSGDPVNATSNPKWHTGTENNTMSWTVSANQSKDLIDNEDLCYSNNIKADGKYGRKVWNKTNRKYPDFSYNASAANPYPNFSDGELSFQLDVAGKSEGPGHFDKGHMIFKHALSRVTLNIKADEGFVPADYADGKVKEVHLNNVPYKGTFDVKEGTWNATTTTTGNVYLVKEETVESGYNLKYTGQIVPEYVIKKDDQSVNMLQFTINNNVYYVTDAMVHKALVGNTTNELDANENIVMKPGKNYVLNITVNKTKIENITATLADWLPVTGNHEQNNAYLKFENKFVEKGSACANFDLYRIPDNSSTPSTTPGEHEERNWYTGYTDTEARASLRQKGSTNVWEAIDWYFESNIHFYHFRTVKQGTTIKPGSAPDPKDYFEIQTGNDYHWGAPMDKDKNVPKYNVDKGYEDFIYYAIGATESTIKLQEFHMMSQVDIVLTTTTGLDKVSLYDKDTKTGTTVKITKIFKKGQVEMGRGLVTKTGDRSDYDVKTPDQTSEDTYYQTKPSEGAAKSKVYSSLVIPQALVEADVYVGLEIQTPDKNMYYVVQKLSEITAGVRTPADDGYNHTNGEKIKRWYPGHHYTYTLTLKKTGIDKITCSLADWKKITGSSDVTLED